MRILAVLEGSPAPTDAAATASQLQEAIVHHRSVLDALEARYPMLCGTIRDHVTQQRRPMLRFYACEEDLSHEPADAVLPDAISSGEEPFWIVGAIAGGS